MDNWVRAASLDEFDGNALYVDCEGYDIVLVRQDEAVYALDDICSHEYSRLSEGEVWDGKVYCVKHGSAFDLKTGEAIGLPATDPVQTFPTKVEDGDVYIRFDP